MKRWFLALFADKDGLPDEARISALLLVINFIVLSDVAVIVNKQIFQWQDFGLGASALALGIGGWFGFRKDN